MNIGMTELALILVIIVVMFGAKKIPELAKGLGSGIKNFKQAMKEDENGASSSPMADKRVDGNERENTKV